MTGYWCESCREIKNLCNVYGYDRVLDILKKVCIRNEEQLENKIKNNFKKEKEITDESYIKPKTRSQYNNEDK